MQWHLGSKEVCIWMPRMCSGLYCVLVGLFFFCCFKWKLTPDLEYSGKRAWLASDFADLSSVFPLCHTVLDTVCSGRSRDFHLRISWAEVPFEENKLHIQFGLRGQWVWGGGGGSTKAVLAQLQIQWSVGWLVGWFFHSCKLYLCC